MANVQADSVTSLVHASTRLVLCLEKHGEQVLLVFFRNPDTLVCHSDVDTNLLCRVWNDELVD